MWDILNKICKQSESLRLTRNRQTPHDIPELTNAHIKLFYCLCIFIYIII